METQSANQTTKQPKVPTGRDSVDGLLECEGRCGRYGECEGVVERVTVKSSNGRRTWGENDYCLKAIATTEGWGYVIIKHSHVQSHLSDTHNQENL